MPLREPGLPAGGLGDLDRRGGVRAATSSWSAIASRSTAASAGRPAAANASAAARRARQRRLAVALQVVDRGQPALGAGQPLAGARAGEDRADLTPGPRRPRPARPTSSALRGVATRAPRCAPPRSSSVRPQLERLAAGPGRVAGARGPRATPRPRAASGVPGAGLVARAQPVGRDLPARARPPPRAPRPAGGGGPGAAARARRRRAPRASGRGGRRPGPGRPRATSSRSTSSASAAGARRRSPTSSRSNASPATAAASAAARASARELGGAHQHRVADRVRHRHLAVLGQLEPVRVPLVSAPVARSARASSSTKKGSPCVRSWIVRASDGRGDVLEDPRQQLGGLRPARAAPASARPGARGGAARCAGRRSA